MHNPSNILGINKIENLVCLQYFFRRQQVLSILQLHQMNKKQYFAFTTHWTNFKILVPVISVVVVFLLHNYNEFEAAVNRVCLLYDS